MPCPQYIYLDLTTFGHFNFFGHDKISCCIRKVWNGIVFNYLDLTFFDLSIFYSNSRRLGIVLIIIKIINDTV